MPALSSFFFFFGLLIIHDCIALAPRPSGRRELLHQTACATVLSWTVGCSATHATPTNSVTSMLDSLRSVPTFCVVDAEGASYMLYQSGTDESAFAKGYAFLTFPGALAVLSDAQRTAEKGGYAELWQNATITVIPADIAIRLALQPTPRTSQKGNTINTVLEIIPGAEEREAGVQLDALFKPLGKVPLFFFEPLKLADSSTPLFFNPMDLLDEWNRQYGSERKPPPRPKVVDLVTLFQYAIRGRGDEIPVLRNKVTFVPHPPAVETFRELKSRGLAPYMPSRMII